MRDGAVHQLIERIAGRGEAPVLYWRGCFVGGQELTARIDHWSAVLDEKRIGQGDIVGVLGDYSPASCSLLLALMRRKAILAPFTWAVGPELDKLAAVAGLQHLFRLDADDGWAHERRDPSGVNPLIAGFRGKNEAGLILFTSGSTGEPKGILHSADRVARKFLLSRQGWKTVLFLMMDHMGGFNTMLGAFAYGGMAICVPERTPESACRAIAETGAELIPATPTFFNLLHASGSWKNFDLSSVTLITYGTEVMPQATLEKIREMFPGAQLKQTYGLSELGVLRSKSPSGDSLWVRIGGDGFETKTVDGILWVRAQSNMIGYLNAANPFDSDGWLCTGDLVEEKDGYIRFLGRKTEIINVGGQKVFPVEVETVLLKAPNVREATAFAISHPILGQVVGVRLALEEDEDPEQMASRLRLHCKEHLARFKVPMRFEVAQHDDLRSSRFKKLRRERGKESQP
jgi:long-chain acyl-CoA synthetase